MLAQQFVMFVDESGGLMQISRVTVLKRDGTPVGNQQATGVKIVRLSTS